MIHIGNTQYASRFGGFRKSNTKEYTVSIPAVALGVGGFVEIISEVPLENAQDISRFAILWDGIETSWREVEGYVVDRKPSWGAPTYEIGTFAYFDSDNHYVYTYFANQTGGGINTPAITLNVKVELYDTPF